MGEIAKEIVPVNIEDEMKRSYMDYAMPRASDLPFISLHDAPTYTKTNPLGMKGCGEAGTVGACGAISNAVLDALAPRGVTHVVEAGPGKVLAGLTKRIDAELTGVPLYDPATLAEAMEIVK